MKDCLEGEKTRTQDSEASSRVCWVPVYSVVGGCEESMASEEIVRSN